MSEDTITQHYDFFMEYVEIIYFQRAADMDHPREIFTEGIKACLDELEERGFIKFPLKK